MTGVEDGKGDGGGGHDLSATDNTVSHQNGTTEKAPVVAGTNMETLPRPGKQSDPSTAFLRAARAGQLEKVLEFLESGVDINASNTNGLNALHLAAKDGHLEIVRELLTRGATVDAATKKGNTALHIASLAGQEEVVQLLVQRGASVNAQSQNGFTPLYMAAQENHDSVVKFLLSKGANQTLATEDGFTPLAVAMQQGHDKVVAVLLESDTRGKVRLPALHIAAKKDDCKAAALLLQNDHNPDVTSKSGFTPLHIAAHYGNDRIASLLYDKGADVNFAAKHNITPMHVAAKWGKIKMVNLLMSKGANIAAKTRDGLTPLHCAARAGHHEVVDILIEKGAPIGSKTKNGLAPLHMASQGDHVDAARILLYHRAPVDEVTVDYLTALHVAAHCGHVRVAKLLLDRNADPNARALNGFTPLHIACKKNRIKVVELLLKHKASIEATTESGLTPLHVASFMGCMNIVIYLLQNEASPDIPTVRGETPLHLAARANQTDIIRILLRNGAQVDARAREEQTPLHVASRLGNVDIVMLLLQHGADVDATTKDLYTPLHIAAKEGQEEVASVLLENGASLTATTKKGFTPLHLAAKYGNMNVARLLLQKNAPVDAQGKNGVTPLHVASHYDHQNVALLLLDKGASPHAMAKNGHTPLHIAARKNQMDIATTLLEYGAKANAESKAGFTPLHLSAQEGHTDMSTLLIEHKADTNHKAKNGLTPLHLCAQEDKTNVAAILVKNGAQVDAVTKAGYTPLHVAAHFGQAAMVRFLLRAGAAVDSSTGAGYTPLHQAAQQGHTLVINLLLESKAKPNAITNNGQTALAIAQKLGYISVVETLKVVTETIITTTHTITIEEKYKVQAPESMQETFMSDSEDEGGGDEIGTTDMNVYGQPPHAQHVYLPSYYQGQMTYTREDPMLSDQQQYRYMTVDDMKSMGDDSMRVNVTDDERDNRHSGGAIVTDTMIKDSYQRTNAANLKPDNVDIHRYPIHVGPSLESLNWSLAALGIVPKGQGMWRDRIPQWRNFLVSFLVDARGGAMRGCRHSGVRVIVPPRKAAMPMRVTCRYLKRDKLTNPPPLMEGEALASRILELGPVGAKFLGPVIIEVPHFASLRGKEREIVILRSDNGETWREHTLEASEEAVQDVLNESFEGEELSQLEDLQTSRIVRVLTVDFPHYFAVVSRIRQEVHAVGPEGGTVSSSAVPQVQAVFPPAALTKKIRVGLQAHPIPAELVAKLLGNRVAVSPIVTVEPRRRKFHKPITLTIPVPQAANKGMINQYSGDAPTLRLLCSITGGQSRAVWEDVTGSTPLTFVKDCVSFTTTVSARFWLMDCRNISEATRMATELYTHATHVPFMAKFVVFAKRVDPLEARLRVFCMTDDKEDKTLEHQEHFTEVAKSRDVEVLEGKTQYMEFAGNLVPVMKSGEQLQLPFRAFKENRVPFTARIKDPDAADMVGRIVFMSEPKVAKGEPPQTPICTLNILLPEKISPETGHSELDLLELSKNYSFLRDGGISRPDTIHRATIRLTDIANLLDRDWEKLAEELNISPADVDKIKSEHPGKPALQAATMFKLWQSNGNKATGNTLEKALNKIGREDIVKKCIFNVELVTDDVEKAVARVRLDQPGFDSLKEELGPSRDSSLRRDGSLANQKHDYDYDGQDLMRNSGSIDDLSNVGNVPHKRTKQQHITITNGTVFNGTSTPIKDKYASEEKEIADDMAEFLEYKCHVTDTMTKRTRDETDDDNKNRQRVIEDANRLVSGVIQDAEKEKEILAMEGLSGVYRDAGKEAEGALGQRDNESLIQSIEGTMLKDVVDSREASIEPLIKKERVVIDDSRGGKIISKTIVTTSKDHPNSASIVTKTTTVKETLTPGQINFFGVNDPVIGLETIEQQTLPSIDVSDVMTKTTVRSSGPTIEEKVITMSKSIVDKPEVQTVAFVANVPTDRAKVKAEGITRVAIDPVTMPADDKRTSEKEKLSKEDKEVADKTPKSKSKGKVNESKKDISSSKLGKDPKKIEGEPKKSAYDGVYNISSEQTKDDGKKKGSIFGGIFKNPKLKKGKSKDSKETSFDSGDEEVKATTREFLEDTRKIADQSMPAVSPTYPEFDSTKLICICPTKLPEQEPHRDPIWATADFLYDSRRSAEAFIPEAHEPKIKPANGQSELAETDGVITTDKKPVSQDASEDLDEPKEKHNFFSNLFKGTKKAESDLDTVTQEVSKSADLIDKKNIKKVEDVEEKVVNGAKDNIKSAKNAADTKARKLDESINKTKDEVDTAVLKSAVVVEDVKNSIRDKGNTVNVDLKRASKEIKSPEDVKRSNEKTKKLVTTSSEDNKPESLALKTDIGDTSDEAKEKSGGFFGIFKSPKSKDKRRSTSKDKDTSKDISFDSGDEELRIATAAFLEDTKRASDKMFEPNISKNLPQEQKKVEVEKFVTSITVNSDVPKDKLKGTSYSVEESPIKNDTNVTTITTTTVTTTKLIDYRKDSSPTPEVTEGIPKVRDTARTAESMEKKEKRKSSDFEDSGDESKHRSNGFFGIFKSPKLKNKIKSRSRDRSTSKEPSFDSGDEELRQATSKFLEDTRKTAEITGSFDASETKPLKDPGVIETTPVSDPIESKNIPVADQLESKTTGQEKGGIFGIFKSPKSNVRSRSKSKEKSPPTVDNDEVELRIATAKFLEDTKNISAIMEEYPYPSAPLAPECEKVIEVKSESQVEGQDDKPGKANEKGGFLSGIFKSAKHAVDEVTEDVKEFWDETKEEAKNEEEKVERVAEQTAEDIKHGVPAAVRSAEDKVSKTILETKKAVDNDVELAKSQAKEKLIDGKDTVVKVVKATEDKVVGEVENAVKVGGSLARNIEDEVKMVKDSADKEIQKDTKDAKDKIAGAAGKVTDTAEEIKDKAEKEGKKIKDKSKGFFSGIFKGGKQATDEVVDDVTKLVDDTKKKVEKEEENIKRTTEDVKNSITEEVKIKQEKAVKKFTNGVDDVHHQLVSDKDAVIDAAKRQSESVSNVVTVASKAAEDAGKTIDQELKDDIKLMKQKVTDVSETVIDNAELAKDRVDKEKKKTKEKGKSFFSGLFKGVKNAADEVAEDIKDFVDETKDEALEEEKQFHRTVEGTAQVIGDTKDKIATDIKTNLVNFAEDAEKAKDTAGKKLATTKETVSDTVTSTVATVSDATTRTTFAAKDTAKTISEDVEKVKDDLEKELKKDSKLVTDKLGEVTESISDSAEAARIEMENQAKALTNEAHSVSDKITENVSNAAKTVDETACKIVEDVNKTKDVTIKKITDDKEKMATAVKGKIKDEVKTVVDGTETVKHKIEKEAKSTKEAGKGFFSGLFKGVKHTADEVAEEFHDFVDETKKEALKEEERTKHTAAETVQAAKDIKDNVVTDVKTNVEKMAVDTAKVKDKGQEILVASKIAITDTAKSSGAALSDAGKKTSRAAQDVTKKIDNQIEAIKDTVDAEMKKDVKFVEDKLASASESIVDGAETTKNAAEQQLESLKNKTNDTTEKIMEDVSKTAKAIEKKSDDVATNVDEVRKAAIKKTHDDIKTIEGKVSDGAKAIVDSAEVAKQKIDKDAKKAKEKGKSFFSGIFKGSKHSTDETADVKDFLDEFKREASDEKAQSIMDAEEKLLSGNDRKSGTSNVVTETVPSTTGEKTESLNEDVVQKLDDAAKEIENAVDKEVTVSANGVSKDAADKEAKKGKARGSGFFSGIFKGTKQTSNDIADDVKDVTDEVKKEVGEFTDTIARADAELQSKIGNGKEAIKLTSDAISNVPTKAGEFVKKTNDNLGEHIEHTINVINTKVIDNEELAKKTLKQESEDLKAKVHDTEAKLAGDARKVVEVVDKKTHEVTKAVDETEKAVEKKLKEDVKTVKDKVSDGTKAITDSAEAVKHKTEKEAKKAKEKGKSFFSGIFKGGKQISDDITDDVKESSGVESVLPSTAAKAAKTAKNIEEKTTTGLIAEIDRVGDNIAEGMVQVAHNVDDMKNATHDKVVAVKETISDKAETTGKTIADTTKTVERKIIGSVEHGVDTINDTTKNVIDGAEKAKDAIVEEVKEDVKQVKGKDAEVAEATVETATTVKAKADKEVKKTKEKGKGFFSGILKGVKHATDEVAEDVKDFVDDTKREALEEEQRLKQEADELNKTIKHAKDKTTTGIKSGAEKVVDSVEEVNDKTNETLKSGKNAVNDALAASGSAISKTAAAADQKISDMAAKTSQVAEDITRKGSKKMDEIKKSVDEELTKDTKLVGEKLAGTVESVDNKGREIIKDLDTAKNATITELKDDVKIVDKKIRDGAEAAVESVENTKNKAEKEGKKAKEASKGFFSGLFKGVKHAADEVVEDVKDFVDETKKEALEEEERAKQAALDASHAIKDTENKVTTNIKAGIDKIADDTVKAKDKAQEKIVSSKNAASSAIKSADETIANTAAETSEAAKVAGKNVGEAFENAKDIVRKEVKDDTKIVTDKLNDVATSIAESADAAKVELEQQAKALKDNAHDAAEKIALSSSKVTESVEKKACEISEDFDKTKTNFIQNAKDDVKHVKEKISHETEAAVDLVETTKHKADKEAKKAKDKGKGLFSGIFKGVKHTADKVTDDVKNIVDETKAETQKEKERAVHTANEAAQAAKVAGEQLATDIVIGVDKVVGGAEKAKDNAQEHLVASEMAVADTIKASGAAISDTASKTAQAVKDAGKKVGADSKLLKDAVDKEIKQDTGLITDTLNDATESLINGAKTVKNDASQQVKALKKKAHDEKEKVDEEVSKVMMKIDDKADEIANDVHETKESIIKGVKGDVAAAKEKISDEAKTFGSSVEATKHKAEKDAKKTKEKGKSLFSGIFKSAKHTADKVGEDIKDFVDETKEQARKEEQIKDTANDAAQVAKNAKDKLTSDVTAGVEKIADGVEKAKDKTQEKLMSAKVSIADAVESTTETISDARSQTAQAARDTARKIEKDSKEIKDAFDKEVKKDTALVADSLVEKLEDKTEKDAKKTKDKTAGMFFGILKGTTQASNETVKSVTDFLDEERHEASEEITLIQKSADDLAESVKNDIHSGKVKEIEKIPEKFIKSTDDVVDKVVEDIESTKKKITEESKKDIEAAKNFVEAGKQKTEKEVKKGKEKSSGFFSGIIKGAKHAVDEVSEDVKEFWDETKEQAQDDEQKLKVAADHAEKTIKDAESELSVTAQTIKDNVSEEAMPVIKTDKSKISGGASSAKAPETMKSKIEKEAKKDNDTGMFFGILRGTKNVNDAVTDDVKELNIREDVKNINEQTVVDIKAAEKKTKEKSSGFFSGIIKGAKHAVDEVSEEVKEFWDETKHEAKDEENRAKHESKDLTTKILKNDKTVPDFVEDEEVIRQQMTADLEQAVQHSADSSMFYTEIPLRSPSHDSVQGKQKSKVSPDKSKGNDEKSEGFFSSLGKGAKSATSKIKKEVDHTSENIKDAAEKFWEDTKYESQEMKASGSYNVSSPLRDIDSPKTHEHDSDDKLGLAHSSNRSDRESPKEFESKGKSVSRIQRKMSPTNESSKVKEINEVRVVRIEGGTSSKSIDRLDDNLDANKLGHLEPHTRHSVTTVITKSVRTAAAIPPPSPDEFGDITIKDVTEEATKRAQILADQALAAGKPGHDSAEIDGTVERHVTSALTKQPVPAPRHSVKSSSLSSSVNKPELTLDLEANHLTLHQHQHKSKSPKSKIPELTKFSLKSRPATSLDSSCSDELSQKSRIPVKTVREKTTFNTTKEEFAVTKEAESGKLITNVEDINDTTAIVSDLLPVNEIDRVTSMKTITTTTTTVTQGLTDPSIDMEKLQDLMETSGYNMKITTTTVTQQTSSLQSKDDKINEENTSDITLKEKIQSISTKSSWESSTKSHDDQDNWDRAQFSMDMSPSSGEAGFAKNGDSRHDLPSDSDSEGSPRPRRRSLSKRRTIGSSSGSDVALHEGAELSPLEDDQESDFLQHSEPSYVETITTEYDPETNERITRTTRTITSSGTSGGGTEDSNDLKNSMQKIVDQFMTEERRAQ